MSERTFADRLQSLEDALVAARLRDAYQEHEQAAKILEAAIEEANGDYAGEPEELLLEFARLVQSCSREGRRQSHRHALRQSYLNC